MSGSTASKMLKFYYDSNVGTQSAPSSYLVIRYWYLFVRLVSEFRATDYYPT